MHWVIAILTTVTAFASLLATILGLPGLWVIVVVAVCLAFFFPDSAFVNVPWAGVFALVFVAVLGELIEFIAGAAGVGRLGGSRRAMWLALAGSIMGAIAGLFAGVPVPVVGPLIASLLFGGIGAAAGAILGERWVGKDWNESTRVGAAAMTGRLLGTVGKGVCAAVMTVMLVWMVWF